MPQGAKELEAEAGGQENHPVSAVHRTHAVGEQALIYVQLICPQGQEWERAQERSSAPGSWHSWSWEGGGQESHQDGQAWLGALSTWISAFQCQARPGTGQVEPSFVSENPFCLKLV